MQYHTKKVEASFEDGRTGKAEVTWFVEMEEREWGIKDMIIHICSVEVEVETDDHYQGPILVYEDLLDWQGEIKLPLQPTMVYISKDNEVKIV